MCRILAYLGEPLPARNLLFDTDHSLVRQTHSPRMMKGVLNLGGFGMSAWDPRSLRPEDPFIYRATTLPTFVLYGGDSNLINCANIVCNAINEKGDIH